jgi:hypothetical protein
MINNLGEAGFGLPVLGKNYMLSAKALPCKIKESLTKIIVWTAT